MELVENVARARLGDVQQRADTSFVPRGYRMDVVRPLFPIARVGISVRYPSQNRIPPFVRAFYKQHALNGFFFVGRFSFAIAPDVCIV